MVIRLKALQIDIEHLFRSIIAVVTIKFFSPILKCSYCKPQCVLDQCPTELGQYLIESFTSRELRETAAFPLID